MTTFYVAMLGLTCLVVVGGAELLLRLLAPQPYLYPRWQHSPEYGHILSPNIRMVGAQPGRWSFTYTINRYGYRGRGVPVSNAYDTSNIVVLGDSYSFGSGVDDGEDYPAIMATSLGATFNVINLGVPGWGLTQEIRRYYEFGQLYRPRAVVLQFCANDLTDNIEVPVTAVSDGKFVFRDMSVPMEWLQIYLNQSSLIQHSQLYAWARQLYSSRGKGGTSNQNADDKRTPDAQQLYVDLLTLFASDLHSRGVLLFMIAVNGQLDPFTNLQRAISELEDAKLLRYVEVAPWFEHVTAYNSPEGHWWGKKAHTIIGERLGELIGRELKSVGASSTERGQE
jgi:hypothetical protein